MKVRRSTSFAYELQCSGRSRGRRLTDWVGRWLPGYCVLDEVEAILVFIWPSFFCLSLYFSLSLSLCLSSYLFLATILRSIDFITTATIATTTITHCFGLTYTRSRETSPPSPCCGWQLRQSYLLNNHAKIIRYKCLDPVLSWLFCTHSGVILSNLPS